MDDFTDAEIHTGETTVFLRWGGNGPPLLLLHGFPETHLMWAGVAPLLAERYTVVCPDLRGYGRSGCPASDAEHAAYSKRAMARDLVGAMERLGHANFMVAGHDRGGRVAYRLALDHPERVDRLAVLDILSTETVWTRADDRLALGYWPWSMLAQPEPLPERILTACADAVVADALDQWGSNPATFPAAIRLAYAAALRDPSHAHAICEEYRAAAGIDRAHDRSDRAAGRGIGCPMLVLWSATGPLATWYASEGGPLGLWREWASSVEGHAIEAGHFFPEEAPGPTADALRRFFAAGDSGAPSP